MPLTYSLPHCAHEEQRPQLVQPKSKAAASSFPMFFLPPYYEHSCQSQNTDAAVLPHGQAPPVQVRVPMSCWHVLVVMHTVICQCRKACLQP
eukprot:1145494-Pelagomonas_calceolata.AAC.7